MNKHNEARKEKDKLTCPVLLRDRSQLKMVRHENEYQFLLTRVSISADTMGLLIETQHIVNNRKRVISSAGDWVHLQVV